MRHALSPRHLPPFPPSPLPAFPPSRHLFRARFKDVCYRDVAWLNGDRLVLASREGFVTLVSPSDVLQEWDVREGLGVTVSATRAEDSRRESGGGGGDDALETGG